MSHEPIPQAVLAELAAAHHAITAHHRRSGTASAVLLRLSIDRGGTVRLEAQALEGGLTLRALVALAERAGAKA